MRIADVICHLLVDPERDVTATSSAQDSLVVEIVTDDGLSGIGETDLNPVIARACVEAPSAHSMSLGLRDLLLGEDPRDVAGLWQKLYVGSAMAGRRGAGINAIGAIDIALHDLRGKALGEPAWRGLLPDGATARTHVRPYASLQPDLDDVDAYGEALVEQALAARARGFGAAKASITLSGPFAHRGMSASWDRATELVAALRAAVGPDFTLMVDVQYAFPDADTALGVLRDWRDFGLSFVETPLWSDDVAGHRRLVEQQEIPIATGEWLTTRHEFRQLVDAGAVDVLQPDIGRVGGLTEACRVAALAAEHGLIVVPHLWKTGISIAAALHFAAVSPNCPYIEFLPAETSDSAIRRELLTSDFAIADGEVAVPAGAGLGVELDRDAMRRFARDEDATLVGEA
jgi:L-alanine-DL-glutamate epimerase-like enolase superfamily enzyme